MFRPFTVKIKKEGIKEFMISLQVKENTPYEVIGLMGEMILVRVGKNLIEFYPRNVEFNSYI